MGTEVEEHLRQRRSMRTPVTGSATMGGPQPSQETQLQHQRIQGIPSPGGVAEGQMPQPKPVPALQLAAETAGSLVGVTPGGFFAKAIGQRVLPQMALRGAEFLGRIFGSGVGSVAGGEVIASMTEETPEQAEQRRIRSAAQGAIGEAAVPIVRLASAPLSRGIRRIFGGTGEGMIAPGAREVTDALRQVGGELSPGQLLEGWVDLAENIGESSILGGTAIRTKRASGVDSAVRLWEDTVSRVSERSTPDQAGAMLQSAIRGAADAQRAATRAAYGALDTKIQATGVGAVVDLAPALRGVTDELSEVLRIRDPAALKMQRLVSLQGPVTFKQADKIRSALNDMAYSEEALSPGLKRYAAKVAHDVDVAMKAAYLKLGPLGQDVLDAAALSRSTSKMGKDTFNDEMVGQLAGKAAPEDVAKTLFRNASPTRIARVMKILDNPRYAQTIQNPEQLKRQLRGAYLTTLTTKAGAGPAEFGMLSGKKMLTQLRNADSTLPALFPDPADQRALIVSARAIEMAEGKTGTATGSIYIGLKQASAVGQLASLGFIGVGGGAGAAGSAAILGVPWVIAKALSMKGVSNAMLHWAENRAGKAGATSGEFVAQLIPRMIEAGLPFQVRDPEGNITDVPAGTAVPGQKPGLKPVSKF